MAKHTLKVGKADGVHGGGKWRGEKERRMAQLDDHDKYVF